MPIEIQTAIKSLKNILGQPLPKYVYSIGPDWDGNITLTLKGEPDIDIPEVVDGYKIMIEYVPEGAEIVFC